MPGVAALTPARFALGLSADFRTPPGLIFFYSCSGEAGDKIGHPDAILLLRIASPPS